MNTLYSIFDGRGNRLWKGYDASVRSIAQAIANNLERSVFVYEGEYARGKGEEFIPTVLDGNYEYEF